MTRLHRWLCFLRLVDSHDGQVSLTNLALLVALWKVARVTTPSMGELSALLMALLAYAGKKWMAGQTTDTETLTQAVEDAKAASQAVTVLTENYGAIKERLAVLDNRTRPMGSR